MFSQFDKSPRIYHRGLGLLSCIWLLAFVSAGLWLLLGPSTNESREPSAQISAQPVELTSFHQPVDSRYRNIERIRVGQRVVTPEAASAEGLPTAVDPLTWKKLTLQGKARWEDGTIDDIEVQTLQPSAWLALHQAVVGASVPIPLDLREMGLPQMNATVMAIDPCPVIEEGPGRVVLTTVNHLNRFLFDLTVHGKRGPPQAVEVTGWHKLFSEDRQAWTSVCELHLGEVLRGRDGELTVASLNRHPGVQRVYNLTVEQEHQYYVSTADVLAHNANCRVNVDAAFADLRQFRSELGGIPSKGGAIPDGGTLARLDFAGAEPIYGVNAHGQPRILGNDFNFTHAEIDALQQALDKGVIAPRGTMYVDRELCSYCRRIDGLPQALADLGMEELILHDPVNSWRITPSGATRIP